MIKEITCQQLKELQAKEPVHIIDVREAEEVTMGKVKGAMHIPLGDIPNRLHELDKDQRYYLICRSGARSGTACEYLTFLGYDVVNVAGGMLEWDGEIE